MSERARPSAADRAAVAALIRAGSRTFHLASLLLPAPVRAAAYGLYGFCRMADDAVDVAGGRADAVEMLRERLARAYAGRPDDHPIDRCLADAVLTYAIPKALPEALIEGLEWDASGRRCASERCLDAYAARVAGAVGAMMAVLMGARDPVMIARACDLGVAMQFTNIARDVAEDAAMGRLYLPDDWMRAAGLDPEAFLAAPRPSAALNAVVARLLARADALYARAETAIPGLPAPARPGILAARRIYAEIGAEQTRRGGDPFMGRVVVSARRKLALLVRAMGDAGTVRGPCDAAPPLDETAFLVDAVAATPGRAPATEGGFDSDVGWVFDLFVDLADRTPREASSMLWRDAMSPGSLRAG
jgi:phytoene synthase